MAAAGLLKPTHLGFDIGGKVYIKTKMTRMDQIGVVVADGRKTHVRTTYVDPALYMKPADEPIYAYAGGQYFCRTTLLTHAARKGIPIKPLIKGSI